MCKNIIRNINVNIIYTDNNIRILRNGASSKFIPVAGNHGNSSIFVYRKTDNTFGYENKTYQIFGRCTSAFCGSAGFCPVAPEIGAVQQYKRNKET